MANQKLDLAVIGSTGLRQYGGMVFEEFLRKLQGRLGALAFREMRDNSSTIGAIAFTIESLIRQAPWRVEPAGDSPEAKAEAEFVDGCLHDMSSTFEDIFMESLTALTYGWALQEIVYKVRRGPENANPRYRSKFNDGRIGWRKMPLRAQETLDRWEFDSDDSGIRGMWQWDTYSGKGNVFIPVEKALLFRVDSQKGNPESRSLYRNAILDWWKLKRILEIEAIGIERDMTGLITMEVPFETLTPSATPDQVAVRTELERLLAGLKRDEREFAMVPSELDTEGKPTGYKFKLLSSGGRRQIDTDAIARRYMTSMTMSVLADFLMLGAGSTGSWALSSDKTRLFAMAIGAILDNSASVWNRYAIPRLMRLNGVPSRLWPELQHEDIETPPLADIGKFIVDLATAGVLRPDKPLERQLRAMAKLPEPEDDDQPLPGEGTPMPAQQQPTGGAEAAPASEPIATRPPGEDGDAPSA